MITPQPQNPTPPNLTATEQRIFASMSALLKRADLEYQGRYLDLDGKRIHYLDYGEGPPVLLLHGGGAGSAIWYRQIEALSKSHRVIAPDHPVFGLSSQSPWEAPLARSLLQYMTELMDALELEKADVVGLSMGAQAALTLAIENPERINRLVIIDSAGLGKAFPLIFKLATVPVLGRLIVRPNRWGQDNYFKTMEVIDSEFDDAPTYRQYAYDVTTPPEHAGAMSKSLGVITTLAGQRSIFTDDQMKSINTPALAIWGEHDKVFPVEHGYRLAELAPNTKLHVIENAAHVPLLDNSAEVTNLITGFLDD